MERSGSETPGRHHGKNKPTDESTEKFSQAEHRQKQSTCDQSPSSQPSQAFDCSTEMSAAQGVSQTPGKYDDGESPYLDSATNRTSGRTSGEGDGGPQAIRAVQHDPKTNQGQEREPESVDETGMINSDNSEWSSARDCDLDHMMLAEKKDVGNSSQWCSICRDIEEWMIQGEGGWSFRIGTWEDLQARAGCPSCDDILSLPSRNEPIQLHTNLYLCRDNYPRGETPFSYFFGNGSEHSRLTTIYATLNPLNWSSHLTLMGSMVDPNWFDVARLQKWLAFCDENHSGQCHSLPIRHESVSTRPRYLIDVVQGCLVESRGDERYFALSYVWGTQQDAGMATKENIDSIKQDGAITVRNGTFRLPRTVEDAIQLTELLGERFLWVDRLCIIQDDLANWHSQIKKMGSIYANAYCTFVASGGSNADHGIAGLSPNSGPRQLLQSRIRFSTLQMIEMQDFHPTSVSAWIKRGWTFQELQLSRRAIFFNNDVRWICHQSEWEEEVLAEPEGFASKFKRYREYNLVPLSVEPWPDFWQWWELTNVYTQRQFQFENDAGAAFAGIEEILGHSFPGGFCFGMPEFYFDIALLWSPVLPMQRRDSKSNLPSWSLLGWKGGWLNNYGPNFAYEWLATLRFSNDKLSNTSAIVPQVNWIQKGPCGEERRIRNDYHIWKRSQDQLPPETHEKLGWRKESNDNDWTHDLIPNVRFRYPVPLGFKTVTDEYRTWPGSLRLRSQSTFLIISNIIDKELAFASCFSTELVTHTGKWAGMLHLNINEAKNVPIGAKCELVALSHGSVSNDDEYAGNSMEEWHVNGRPKATEKYEFYNVMWIRREGTYVVRENVGRVEKSVWDSQELQDIDVELR